MTIGLASVTVISRVAPSRSAGSSPSHAGLGAAGRGDGAGGPVGGDALADAGQRAVRRDVVGEPAGPEVVDERVEVVVA